MKKFLLVMALCFAVLTVVCFISSARTVEGLDFKVANIQDTIFCAASAIISAINAVGYAICSLLEKTEEQKARDAEEREIEKAKEKEPVIFCDNCGQRKSKEDLIIVKMNSRKGIVEKKICNKCIELEEVKSKIVE